MEEDIFIECICGSHMISFTYDQWEIDKPSEPLIYMSLWSSYNDGRKKLRDLPFKDRIKFLWHLLTKGFPWDDQVVLTVEELEKIRDVCNKFIEKRNEERKNVPIV